MPKCSYISDQKGRMIAALAPIMVVLCDWYNYFSSWRFYQRPWRSSDVLSVWLGWFSIRTGTSVDDGKAHGKDLPRLPLPNLPLCHWSTQLFNLRAPSSTDVPILLVTQPNQTDRKCWTIQTHSDELNWAKRRTCHERNSLSLVRIMKSLTFGLSPSFFSFVCAPALVFGSEFILF